MSTESKTQLQEAKGRALKVRKVVFSQAIAKGLHTQVKQGKLVAKKA